MNNLGISLIWLVGQVTLLCLVTILIYLFARRQHPAAGATAVLSGLLLTVVLSLGMFSPCPRWSFERGDDATAVDSVEVLPSFDDANLLSSGTPTTDVDSDFVSNRGETARAQPAMESRAAVDWRTFWSSLGKELSEPTAPATDAGIRWTGWLAMGLLFAVLIGAVRLISGWVTVRGYLRRSKLIGDCALSEMTDVLRAELECSREVELRQSADVVSPSTFGWRRPVILLPPDWKNWSQNERRAVLAHELAHVTSGDAVTWLAAQFGLMLHFYHPLMHWLAQRLRLEQELAADALAARSLGDSQIYLTTLAELAVRQPDRPLAWPARAFLPTRGTLLRRIEMLRDTKAQPLRSSILRRGTVLALTMLVGLFVAGLRPPTLRDAVAQESATTETIQERQGFNLENVTASTVVLFGLRPSQIAERPDMKQVVAIVEESLESEKTGLYIEDIDQYLVFASDPPNSGLIPVMEIRMKEPTDFGPFLKELVGDVELLAVGNESILVLGDSASPAQSLAAYQPDDQTVLFGAQPSIENLATRQNHQSDQPAWSVRFQPFADGEACLLIDVAQFRPQFQHAFQRNPNPMLGMFAPLWEEADLAIGGARLDDRLTATLNIWGKDTESADKIEQTLRTLIPVGQGMLQGYKASLERMPNDTQAVVKPIVDFATSVLSDVKIEKTDEKVDVTFEGDGANLAIATVVALPALQQAREAARRTQSQNNLKQIGLAFHLYHDAHGHFPPPVLIGPDDKTPYSWRVAVLPFLDQKALYEQYDRTQPWDSEHNQKVLEQMPPQFKSPNDDAGSTNAAYFVLTGPDTAAGETNGEGTKIPDITDGMANTLLVVESKLDIPWTKPEDIPYSPDAALPKFGGFHQPGFFGLRADGSVTYFSEHIDENLLRALITRNGGEDIPAN